MKPIKANPGEIDFAVFDTRKLQEAVRAIQEQSKLSRDALWKLEHERDTLMACFDEVVAMMQPQEESCVRARRKLGPKSYGPIEDRALQDVNKAGGDRQEVLLKRIEPIHATWQKAVAARHARTYLYGALEECLKLAELITLSLEIEKG